MTFPIETRGLTVRFGDTVALDDVSVAVPGRTICGLLGRNGAGKSTLLAVLAGFRAATGGTVRVDGEDPWDHSRVMPDVCLIRETGDFEPGDKVTDVVEIAETLRPRWDGDLAARLLDRFAVPTRTKLSQLSHGQQAAMRVTVGMAARAPLTSSTSPTSAWTRPPATRSTTSSSLTS